MTRTYTRRARRRGRAATAKRPRFELTAGLLESYLPTVVEVLIQKVRRGEMEAVRLYMQSLMQLNAARSGAEAHRPSTVRLVKSVKDAQQISSKTIQSLQRGEVSPKEALATSSLLRDFVHLTEAAEFETRIASVEQMLTQQPRQV